jgi:hypothetical protein
MTIIIYGAGFAVAVFIGLRVGLKWEHMGTLSRALWIILLIALLMGGVA